jgi:hypothetical protein
MPCVLTASVHADVGQVSLRMRVEVVGQLRGGASAVGRARRQHQQLRPSRRFETGSRGRFLHHHMGVGPAHPE